MPPSDEAYFRIVDALYAGVFDEDAWRHALESIPDYFGAGSLSLFSVHPESGFLHRADVVRIDPRFMVSYGSEWIQHDPRHEAGKSLRDGEVATEAHLVDWGRFVKTPVYNEFCLPAGIPRFIAAWVQRRRDRGVVISLHRSHVHGAYSDAEQKRLSMFIPHIRRTVEMKDRMALAQVSAAGFVEGMDRLPLGILLLDTQLRILHTSQNADRLLRAATGIAVREGRLDFVRPADRSRFLARMKEDPACARQGDMMHIARGDGLAPLCLALLPLPCATQAWLVPTARWMVMLHAPEMGGTVPVERIRRALAVTGAEAALVQRLLGGQTLLEAAKSLHISPHTARSQLKSVYGKTGLNSQAQLMRLLLSNPLIGV